MARFTTLVNDLIRTPRPVLCLDTCDLLEIVQCLDWENGNNPRGVTCVETAQRLWDTITVNPRRVMLVVTDLVVTEWNQNITAIREKAVAYLRKIDQIAGYPYQAAGFVRTTLPSYSPLSASTLVHELETLSLALLNQAKRLALARPQQDLAVRRVMNKTRPSHDGHVKDSINLEHYLEFARRLRARSFGEVIVFVSKNRKDYSTGGNASVIHPDLEPELTDPGVRIEFHGSLTAALRALRI